jgi:hypothetical protein
VAIPSQTLDITAGIIRQVDTSQRRDMWRLVEVCTCTRRHAAVPATSKQTSSKLPDFQRGPFSKLGAAPLPAALVDLEACFVVKERQRQNPAHT